MATWGEFEQANPALAAIGADRFRRHLLGWLATTTRWVPASPSRHPTYRYHRQPLRLHGTNLERDGRYALAAHVPDIAGTEHHGEFLVAGQATPAKSAAERRTATQALADVQFPPPPARHLLFELEVSRAVGTESGDQPQWLRWRSNE
ncbi:MAG TPA: hypothetical protein VI462_02715 [Acidimicrobiia bacterium]